MTATIANATLDSTLRIKEYKGHKNKILCLAWSLDGRRLATGSKDSSIIIWHPEHSTLPHLELKGHQDSVDQLVWSPIDRYIFASGSSDKFIIIWDGKQGKELGKFESGEVINMIWSSDGKKIIAGTKDDSIMIIDIVSKSIISKQQFNYEINEMSLFDDNHIIIATGTGHLNIISLDTLKVINSIMASQANCYCIKMDPLKKRFVVGAADSLVTIWQKRGFISCQRAIERMEWPIRSLSISFDGRYVASGSEDLFIDIADITTGDQIVRLDLSHASISLMWHPSKLLLAYSCDETIEKQGCFRVFGFPPLPASVSASASVPTGESRAE